MIKLPTKANRSLGLVKRTLKPCTPEVKERAYKALIRPLLEYASAAWNPHTNRDTEIIQKVQRRAARFVAHDYTRSTNSQDLVNQLGGPPWNPDVCWPKCLFSTKLKTIS